MRLLGSPKKASHRSALRPLDDAFAKLERAKAELARFSQENADIVTRYLELTSGVDAAVEQVKDLYLENKDAVGPSYNGFSVKSVRHVDADLLLQLAPATMEYVKYSMPMAIFDPLVLNGIVPEDVAEQVLTIKDQIMAPKK